MKFSAKGEYGVRALIDIGLNFESGPVQVKEISRRQGIPERFLEQVMSALKKARLVESIRGAQGGYLVTRPLEEITLADVIQALEGPLVLMDCVQQQVSTKCGQSEVCVIKDAWRTVNDAVVGALDSITIKELCSKISTQLTTYSASGSTN